MDEIPNKWSQHWRLLISKLIFLLAISRRSNRLFAWKLGKSSTQSRFDHATKDQKVRFKYLISKFDSCYKCFSSCFSNVVCLCLLIHLSYFYSTNRRAKLHPQKQRSKYICKPEAVVEAGNHFVWEFVSGKGSLNVPADAGILHHYRVSVSSVDAFLSFFQLSFIRTVFYMQNKNKYWLSLLTISVFKGLWIWWWRLHQGSFRCWSHST